MQQKSQKNKEQMDWLKELAESDRKLDIRLTNDFAFKTIFRNKKALTGLLSALLEIPHEIITNLEFPDTFLKGEYPGDKEGIVDVKVTLNKHEKINIEIQVSPFPFWEERSLFYTAKYFVEGFLKGQDFSLLETTIHIGILVFPLHEGSKLYSVYELRDRDNHRLYSDKISLRVLQLDHINQATQEEQQTEIYQWAKMLSSKDWKVLIEMAEQNEFMKEAVQEMEKINSEKAMRYRYLEREMALSDEVTIRNYYTKKGLEQGMEIGLEQGIEKGMEQGVEKGMSMGTEQMIQIMKLLNSGCSVDGIAADAGCTKEFVERVKKECF